MLISAMVPQVKQELTIQEITDMGTRYGHQSASLPFHKDHDHFFCEWTIFGHSETLKNSFNRFSFWCCDMREKRYERD